MGVYYDKNGDCTTCGRPGSGLAEEVCTCLDEDAADLLFEDPEDADDALEEIDKYQYRLTVEGRTFNLVKNISGTGGWVLTLNGELVSTCTFENAGTAARHYLEGLV